MNKQRYKVVRTDFKSLERFLNSFTETYPNYHVYQILSEHCYNGAYAVVILELNIGMVVV